MKFLVALALTLTGSVALASPETLCSQQVIRAYRPLIDQPQFTDKYKHCAMSCVLTLQCGRIEAGTVGVLKEIADLFTPGNADLKDLRADNAGISLVTRRYAENARECYVACRRLYPAPPKGVETW